MYTLPGLSYGTYSYADDAEWISYYGATTVAVDASYFYTWDGYKNPAEVYVYDHTGAHKLTLYLE